MQNMQRNKLYRSSEYGGGYRPPTIQPTFSVKTMDKKKLVLIIIGCVLTVLLIALLILNENTPRNYYMKDLFVSEATIVNRSSDDGYAVQVSLSNPSKVVSIDEDNTWVTVDSQFYNSHNSGDRIGVLVCNYDVMKESNFGLLGKSGQKFEKELWTVDSAYDNLAAAQTEYPRREFTANATLKSLVKLNDGELYYVMNYEDREITVRVSSTVYAAHQIGDSVPCKFEGYGDFVKITNIPN